jgi:uncharacterized protein
MPEWLVLSRFWIILVVMLVGLFGLVVPVFPGITVIWLAALGYGVWSGFSTLGIWLFAGITLLMVAGTLIDNVLIGAGAVQGGSSMGSMWAGIGAGLLGTLIFPPFGGLIAAPLTVLLLEYRRHRDWNKAVKALRGMAVGWGTAFVVRFGLGVLMIILWVIWDWAGS